MSEETVTLSTTDMEILKKTIMDSIIKILPDIINEIKPIIIQSYKQEQLSSHTPDPTPLPPSDDTKIAIDLICKDRKGWNKLLEKQENKYSQIRRTESYLTLYQESLNESPIYVPQKFRSDNWAIKSRKEIEVVHKFNIQRLQTEMEMYNIRLSEFKEELKTIENELLEKAGCLSPEEKIIDAAMKDIEKKINFNMVKVDKQWKKKEMETRTSWKKDQIEHNEKIEKILFPLEPQTKNTNNVNIKDTNTKNTHTNESNTGSQTNKDDNNEETPATDDSKNLNGPQLRSGTSQATNSNQNG